MSYRIKQRKDGGISVEFRCTVGRDPVTGKQITIQDTWRVPDGYSDNRIRKEAEKRDAVFLNECNSGKKLPKTERKKQAILKQREEERRQREYESIPTFREYLEIYLKALEADEAAKGTIRLDRTRLSIGLKKLGDVKMPEITRAMVQDVLFQKTRNKDLKYNTKKSYHSIWKGFFEKAEKDGIISESPIKNVDPPTLRKNIIAEEQKKRKDCSIEEIQYLLECLQEEPIKNRALITVLIYSGMRRGEAAGLKWENVNLDTGEVCINNNIQYTSGSGVYETATKTGRTRSLILAPEAISTMIEYRKHVLKEARKNGRLPSIYCFPNLKGGLMSPDRITEVVGKFGRKYGIEGLHPHMFRHSVASILCGMDVNVATISAMLGHANVATTLNIYTHVREESLKRASSTFGDAISKAEEEKEAKNA